MIKSKKIIVIFVLLLLVFSGAGKAYNLQIEIEDFMLANESEKKVTLKMVNEAGEVIETDRELMLKVSRGGVVESKYLNKGIKLVDGKAEFTYLAPERLGRAKILIIDPQTNKSTKKSLVIVSREQLEKHQESGYATITDFSGEVMVRSSGEENWEAAKVGQKLYKDDFIKTLYNSWSTLKLFEGSEITIEPSTEFKIVNLTGDVENKQLGEGIFELIVGKVLNEIDELTGRGSRFKIETDSATAGVRGTYFEVSYRNGKNSVRVYEGSVRIEDKSSQKVYAINKQEEITLDETTEDSDPKDVIQNQIKEHKTTKEEKLKKIEEKKEKIKEKVLENKAHAKNEDNKGKANDKNKGSGNNNSGGNSDNNIENNKGPGNNNSGGNNKGPGNNNNSVNNKSPGSNNGGGNEGNVNSNSGSNNSSGNKGSENNNSGGNNSSNSESDNSGGSGNSNSGGNSSNNSENNNDSGGNGISNSGNNNSGENDNNGGNNSNNSGSNKNNANKKGPK